MVFAVLFATVVLALLLSRRVYAHDLWLESETTPEGKTNLRLLLGDHFIAEEEKPYESEVITDFTIHSASGQSDLRDGIREGVTPVLFLPGDAEAIVTMERAPRFLTLDADKFESYLREEGLEAVRKERHARGETALPGRETYSRYLKTLLGNREGKVEIETVPRLEVVPQFSLKSGISNQPLSFLVMLEGTPLIETRVTAYTRSAFTQGETSTQIGLTDAQGRVVFTPAKGEWLVRLVTMRRVEQDNADWESAWTALRFRLRG